MPTSKANVKFNSIFNYNNISNFIIAIYAHCLRSGNYGMINGVLFGLSSARTRHPPRFQRTYLTRTCLLSQSLTALIPVVRVFVVIHIWPFP